MNKDYRKELIMVRSESPENFPEAVLRAYIQLNEGGRWESHTWGDSKQAEKLVVQMNDRLDRELAALNRALEIIIKARESR